MGYFESERGRSFIRSTLRRSRLVEKLIDQWLAAHPDHPALPHLEDDEPVSLDNADSDAAIEPERAAPSRPSKTKASANRSPVAARGR
jgi:hypothetical protein